MAGLAPSDSPSPLPALRPRSASVMLYNGVSNRSRGWKSRQPGDLEMWDGKMFRQPALKKFDGASRSSFAWDRLRKDPDLFFRNGNCQVHLYEKGQSQRGAAFKVPLGDILAAQSSPLVAKFVDRTVSEGAAYQNGQVDLYIPAPAAASRSEALQYHIATRNFFAWIMRRSLVGEQLGGAIIGLLHSMDEFRDHEADNFQDLLDYLDEEGYLDFRNQPEHAVALLHVAEVFQIRDLYIDAFAHCVGMSERLHKCPELSRISVTSRKLLRRARLDMDFRLSRAGAMLSDLLEEELSEAHVGLSAGARAHLHQFRAYVHGFYSSRLGSFPPPPSDSRCATIFRPNVYCSMKTDFEMLYQYLVDEKFTTADSAPSVAQGGLCALQSVHAFDLRHKFSPLDHPLPLLPEPTKTKESRRGSVPWFIGSVRLRGGSLRPEQRLAAQASLMRATNLSKVHLLDNELVSAYRDFEKDSVMVQHKRPEELGDARKVRWLFVYAMYQTLRSCAEVPNEVNYTAEVDYHVGVSTKSIPPWQAKDITQPSPAAARRNTKGIRPHLLERNRSVVSVPLVNPVAWYDRDSGLDGGIEIKPDIDYFALTHQEESATTPGCSVVDDDGLVSSQSQGLTRNMSIRRSLSVFKSATQRPASANSMSSRRKLGARKASYHEIIVQGYGNGTNPVVMVSAEEGDNAVESNDRPDSRPRLSIVTTASRAPSTSSKYSRGSSVSACSATLSSASTTPTTVADPQTPTSSRQTSANWKSTVRFVQDIAPASPIEEDSPTIGTQYDTNTFPRRRQQLRKSVRHMWSNDDMLPAEAPAAAAASDPPPPVPRRSSKRCQTPEPTTKKRWSLVDAAAALREAEEDSSGSETEFQPSPLRIQKARANPVRVEVNQEDDVFGDWHDWEQAVQSSWEVSPPCTWEQFTDLGGHQPIHMLR